MQNAKIFESPLTALKWSKSRGLMPPTRDEIIDTDKKGRQYWRTVYIVNTAPSPSLIFEDE